MRIPAIAALLTALVVIPGCTSITNTYNYGDDKPTVVHDTVYVAHGSTAPGGAVVPAPDTLTAPVPGGAEAPLTGRVSWIEELDPGTASVETIIDYDLGITTHRMMGNVLSSSGLRFELNAMVRITEATGAVESFLIPEFISARDWNAENPVIQVPGSGRPSEGESTRTDPGSGVISSDERSRGRKEVSGRPGTSSLDPETRPSGDADLEAVIMPSLLIRLDGAPYVLYDMDDFECEAHATMLYGVEVFMPVTAEMLEALATGTAGYAEIRDLGGSVTGTFTTDNFTNFGTFLRYYGPTPSDPSDPSDQGRT